MTYLWKEMIEILIALLKLVRTIESFSISSARRWSTPIPPRRKPAKIITCYRNFESGLQSSWKEPFSHSRHHTSYDNEGKKMRTVRPSRARMHSFLHRRNQSAMTNVKVAGTFGSWKRKHPKKGTKQWEMSERNDWWKWVKEMSESNEWKQWV